LGISKGRTLADDISLPYGNDAVKRHISFVSSGYPDTLRRSVAIITHAQVGYCRSSVAVVVRSQVCVGFLQFGASHDSFVSG